MVFWGANVAQGPYAVPGSYSVRVTADGQTATKPFKLAEDSWSKATQADLQAQFDLDEQVAKRESEANQAVIDVRKLRDQVNDRVAKTESAELRASGQALVAKLTEIEETIYQTKSHASEDPLNFPIKINNRMGHLMGVIEGSDAKPTDQTYAVFKKLSAELDAVLANFKNVQSADLAAFNKQLTSGNLQPVSLTGGAESH